MDNPSLGHRRYETRKLEGTQSKAGESKYRLGSIRVETNKEKPSKRTEDPQVPPEWWTKNPRARRMFESGLRLLDQGQQPETRANTAQLDPQENIQVLAGELSREFTKLVDKVVDSFKFRHYYAKPDNHTFNDKAQESVEKDNQSYYLRNEAIAWIGQYILANDPSFVFYNTKEFGKLRQLMALDQGNSQDDIAILKNKLESTQEISKDIWPAIRDSVVKQIVTTDERSKELEDRIKGYNKVLEEDKEYKEATIQDTSLQAKERAKQAEERVKQGTIKYAPKAQEFVKQIDKLFGYKKQQELLTDKAKEISERLNALTPKIHANKKEGIEKFKEDEFSEKVTELFITEPSQSKTIAQDIQNYLKNLEKIIAPIRSNPSDYIAQPPNTGADQEQESALKKDTTELLSKIKTYAQDFAKFDITQFANMKLLFPNGNNFQDIVSYARDVEIQEASIVNYAGLTARNAKANEFEPEKGYFAQEIDCLDKAIDKQTLLINKLTSLAPKDGSSSTPIEYTMARSSYSVEKDRLVREAQEKKKELEKRKEDYSKIKTSYAANSKDDGNELLVTNKEITSIRAKDLAEQYKKRVKKTKDRVKQYKGELKLLDHQLKLLRPKLTKLQENSNEQSGRSDIQQAAQALRKYIDHLEEVQRNTYKAAGKATEIANLEENVSEKYSNIVRNANDAPKNIETEINSHLLVIKQKYREEVLALENIKGVEKELKQLANTDKAALQELRKCCEDSEASSSQSSNSNAIKEKAILALNRNSHYIEGQTPYNNKKMEDLFKALDNSSKSKDVEDLQDLSVAHIVMDNVDTGSASINGVYMELREIRRIDVDKEKGEVTVVWREDIPSINILGRPYAKRLSKIEIFESKDSNEDEAEYEAAHGGEIKKKKFLKKMTFDIPGTNYDRPGNERAKFLVNLDGTEREYDTETLKQVDLRVFEKHEGLNESLIRVETKAMPNGKISFDQTIDPNKLKNTYRFNLEKMKLITPDNQFTVDLNTLDLTETIVDPTRKNGISLRTDKEWRLIPLKFLGTMNTRMNALKDIQSDISYLGLNMKDGCLSYLKSAHASDDPTQSALAFKLIDSIKGNLDLDRSSASLKLSRIPKNMDELKDLKSDISLDQGDRAIKDNHISSQKVLCSHNILKDLLHQDLKKEVNSIVNSDKTREDKNKELQELYKKVGEGFHYEQKYDFPLLVDPKSADREIKCARPNMPMLVKEYEHYRYKKAELSDEEKEYVKDIELFVARQDDMYLKNEIYLIKANSTTDFNEMLEALGKLTRKEPETQKGPETWEEYRQYFEYFTVEHIENAIHRAKDKGANPELIRAPLRELMLLRQSLHNSFEYAEKALNSGPDTPIADIKENIEKISKQVSFEVSEGKFSEKKPLGLDEEEKQLEKEMKAIVDDVLESKDPVRFAFKSVEISNKVACLTYKKLMEAFKDDPEFQEELEGKKLDYIKYLTDKAHRSFHTAISLRQIDDLQKFVDRMFWRELLTMLVMKSETMFTKFNRIGSFNKMMGQMMKDINN
jgi:hypothetical protein